MHWGRKVLEVRPPVAIDKGLGIAAAPRRMPRARRVYIGDDTTDLDAFAALAALVVAGDLERHLRGRPLG